MASKPNVKIGIVGASGLVGSELINILHKNNYKNIKACASDIRIGNYLDNFTDCENCPIICKKLDETFFDDVRVVFFCVSSKLSEKWATVAQRKGVVVIDGSSAFRMDDNVPLVLAGVNDNIIDNTTMLIASPNCCASLMCMVLKPLLLLSNIDNLVISTYQAISGAGIGAIEEELNQAVQTIEYKTPHLTPQFFPSVIFRNCFSHDSPMDSETGYNEEELKIISETQKILNKQFNISATCIRCPFARSHCISMTINFEQNISLDNVVRCLNEFPGVIVQDDREHNSFPEPLKSEHLTDVFVGRIRKDINDKSGKTYHMFISGDQLLKGASYNMFEIFERCLTVNC